MSYENFRNEVFVKAMKSIEPSLLDKFMTFMDEVSEKYNFEKKCTDIIHINGIPEDIIKSYIATKVVAHISIGQVTNINCAKKHYKTKLLGLENEQILIVRKSHRIISVILLLRDVLNLECRLKKSDRCLDMQA